MCDPCRAAAGTGNRNPPRAPRPDLPAAISPRRAIVETELAAEFNVSRTPIRQALQRLDYDGLVETRNGVGTTVTGVDFQEFKDVYAFRLKLSEMIGDFGRPERVSRSLNEIEALIPRVEALLQSRDFEQFWQINHELHFAVNALIGNSAMRRSTLLSGLACVVHVRGSHVGRRGPVPQGGG
ncbi:GntR family transcriptional regulator [Rhizobium leguminosarum]|uniref:GntR family transcriptional regulator n=1 Tax=Rhizobium leguminosarum TaxID=384 RepID=UPI001FE1E799|nr:GntR family transcriptional regulator [Rhizobium leguminosarum]